MFITDRYYIKEDGYEEYKEECDLAITMYMTYPDKGPMAQTKLTEFLKNRENQGYTILNADKVCNMVHSNTIGYTYGD